MTRYQNNEQRGDQHIDSHPELTMEQAKQKASALAARTGEPYAVCDDNEGTLFVVPADSYLDCQLWVTTS